MLQKLLPVVILLPLMLSGCDEPRGQQYRQQPYRQPTMPYQQPYQQYRPPYRQPTMPYCPDGRCPVRLLSGGGLPAIIGQVFDADRKVGFAQVPNSLAQNNWRGKNGFGSCAWASLITALRWQGQDAMAGRVSSMYESGASWIDLVRAGDSLNLKYSYTRSGDSRLLEWASQTKRCGVIFYKPAHACTFVGFQGNYAHIIDPNKPSVTERINKQRFVSDWQNKYNGVFFVPVYAPGTPIPQISI